MAFNPFQHLDPNRIINDAVNSIHRELDGAVNGLRDAGHHITDDALNELKSKIEPVLRQAENEFHADLDKVKQALSHIGDLKSAFTAESIKAGINTCLSFIQRYPILPPKAELGLSIVTVHFDDIVDTKIAHLQKHLNSPPTDRAGITDLILTLAPNELHIGGDFSLFSDALGARGGVTFTSEQIATIINHICDDIGV